MGWCWHGRNLQKDCGNIFLKDACNIINMLLVYLKSTATGKNTASISCFNPQRKQSKRQEPWMRPRTCPWNHDMSGARTVAQTASKHRHPHQQRTLHANARPWNLMLFPFFTDSWKYSWGLGDEHLWNEAIAEGEQSVLEEKEKAAKGRRLSIRDQPVPHQGKHSAGASTYVAQCERWDHVIPKMLAQHGTLSCQKASPPLPDFPPVSRKANEYNF